MRAWAADPLGAPAWALEGGRVPGRLQASAGPHFPSPGRPTPLGRGCCCLRCGTPTPVHCHRIRWPEQLPGLLDLPRPRYISFLSTLRGQILSPPGRAHVRVVGFWAQHRQPHKLRLMACSGHSTMADSKAGGGAPGPREQAQSTDRALGQEGGAGPQGRGGAGGGFWVSGGSTGQGLVLCQMTSGRGRGEEGPAREDHCKGVPWAPRRTMQGARHTQARSGGSAQHRAGLALPRLGIKRRFFVLPGSARCREREGRHGQRAPARRRGPPARHSPSTPLCCS